MSMIITGTYNQLVDSLVMTPITASQPRYTGRNLFNPSILYNADTTGGYNPFKFDGEAWVGPNQILYNTYSDSKGGIPIKFKPNTQYFFYVTMYGEHSNPESTALGITIEYTDGTRNAMYPKANGGQYKTSTGQSLSNKTIDYVWITYGNGQIIHIKEFMIAEASSNVPYEPYTGGLPAPCPSYPIPINYTKTEEIIIQADELHENFHFPKDYVDAETVWVPTNYSTDFIIGIYQEGTRMKKQVGTDYIKIIPLCKVGATITDTAYVIRTPEIYVEPGYYGLVFKYKKVNTQQKNFAWNESIREASYYTQAVKLSTTISNALETPYMRRYATDSIIYSSDEVYDEGWCYARYNITEAGLWEFRIGVDYPDTLYMYDDREAYIEFTNIMLVKGNLPANKTLTQNRVITIADGNKRICIDNKEVPKISNSYGTTYIVDDVNSKVIGKCGILRLTGTENWTKSGSYTHTFLYYPPWTIQNGLCTHFTPFSSNTQIDVRDGVYLNNTRQLLITKLDCDNLNDFKTWLQGEYNKGTPVTIVCGDRNATHTDTYDKLKVPMLPITAQITTNLDTEIECKQSDGKVHKLKKLNYLQSSGQQYIDTEWLPKTTSKIVMDFEGLNTLQDRTYIGIYYSGYKNELAVYKYDNVYYFRPNIQDTTRLTQEVVLGTKYHVETTTARLWVVNNTILSEQGSNADSTKSMFVFGRHYESSTQLYDKLSDMRLYNLELYDNNVLTKKFIPVLDENNVACLYECVSGKCYYNKLTQPFTYG